MTEEGASLYYLSKQSFNFKKACSSLNELGLSVKNSETLLITGIGTKGDNFEESSIKKAQNLFQFKNFGFDIWLENGHKTFWSFVEQDNYFFHNLAFNYLDCNDIEQRASRIFIKFALQELEDVSENFLGFTLDQFGHNENYDFSKILQPNNNDILSHHYISDIVFLSKEKIKRIYLNEECQIISINQQFDCIAKNQELADYVKSLL